MPFYRELTGWERLRSTASVFIAGVLVTVGAVLAFDGGVTDIGISDVKYTGEPISDAEKVANGLGLLSIGTIMAIISGRRLYKNSTMDWTPAERRALDENA